LHAFNNRTNVRSVIRRDYRADLVRSNRMRTPDERNILAERGGKIAVLEAQGALFFGSAEQLLRRLGQLAAEACYVIVDFKRVHLADTSARKLILRAAHAMAGGETELLFASMVKDGPLGRIGHEFADRENEHLARMFRDTDAALEWCEDRLLDYGAASVRGAKFAPSEINLFKGLEPGECRLVESIVQPLVFEKGDVIIREGADANLFFVLARGTVSVQIRVPGQGNRRKRVASIRPGLSFGEMALLDDGKRSADIVADERVICYGLRVEQLHELTAEHPNIMITILSNLTREFSERLRHANEENGVLE
jgi:glutaminase